MKMLVTAAALALFAAPAFAQDATGTQDSTMMNSATTADCQANPQAEGCDTMSTNATSSDMQSKDGAMSSDESNATTAASGQQGASSTETTTPSGGVVPGQAPK